MASQIIGVFIVCWTVCLSADRRKHQSSASLAFVRIIHRWPTGELPIQKDSNAENVFIWWRHHVFWNELYNLISVVKDETCLLVRCVYFPTIYHHYTRYKILDKLSELFLTPCFSIWQETFKIPMFDNAWLPRNWISNLLLSHSPKRKLGCASAMLLL